MLFVSRVVELIVLSGCCRVLLGNGVMLESHELGCWCGIARVMY